MNVLFGCEESGKGRDAFAKLGHNAWSCDLQSTRSPGNHYQCDIMEALYEQKWDLIVLHPDCTAMSLSGNRWYGKGMSRHQERIDAVRWTLKLWEKATEICPHVAMENPLSVIFNYLPNVQYIQPYQFGHGETKKTGLALYGLPRLVPKNEVDGRENRIWKMPPSKNRKRDRSESYEGIMDAMAQQWGNLK